MAVLCMQYKIRCTVFTVLYLYRLCPCGLHMVLWLYISVLMRLVSAEPRTFIPLSVSMWNDFADPIFDGVGLAGFNSMANFFLFA